jgi:hypothetical protein
MADFIHIDKLLTNMATRYRVNDAVGDFIAPPFKVKKSSDKYTEYSKGSLRLYDNKISGREKAPEVDVEVSESNYSCEEYALSKFVSDRKRNNADKPINMDIDAVRKVKDAQIIAREKRVFDIAGSTSIVTQNAAASNKWDVEASGTPVADIRAAMAQIWKGQAGSVQANAITIPVDVSIEMIGTEEYRDYFKYSGLAKEEQFNLVSGLKHLGLNVLMAGVHGGNSNEGGASDPGAEAIWNDTVLVFHRQPNPNLETRTFMYSPYVVKDRVRRIRKEEERGTKFEVYEDIDELLIDAKAAYLITDTLT